ncbi:MAG: tRNA lysidine(34) synthetase TilS [Candidatus Rokubacteria bacterium]|nr:tRNA lysidine(34) synthetase TilS [Candidatus Rokubacteria bacterium]
MSLLPAVAATIRRHAMLAGGETVLVAVSGGADSVALLHLLVTLRPAWRLTLHVLHVDHRLRADSARDAEFVRSLGLRLGVPVDVTAVEVPAGGSLEAAARAARHAALEACAERIGAGRIALGHTADDQAETVLMRVLSGAGLRGLAGIPAVRGRIIRPLLETRHAALVAELTRAGLAWLEDPSNRDPKFLRNRIRHDLLPFLAAEYNPDIVGALTRAAAAARESVDALDRVATGALERLASHGPEGITLPLDGLRRLPAPVAAETLRQAVARLGSRGPLRAWAHRILLRTLASPPPRRPFILAGVTVEVSTGQVRLATRSLPALEPRVVAVPGLTPLPEIGLVLGATLVDAAAYATPRDPRRAAFDADLTPEPLVVRARRRGDRFSPFGAPPRRLKTFLINAKVPRWERRRLPVVEAGGAIVWLGGLRRSSLAPVTRDTRRVLQLELIPLAE